MIGKGSRVRCINAGSTLLKPGVIYYVVDEVLDGETKGMIEVDRCRGFLFSKHRFVEAPIPDAPFTFGSDTLPGLCKIIEEKDELGTVLGKLMMTGGDFEYFDGRDLSQELQDEIADLDAALKFFRLYNDQHLDQDALNKRSSEKLQQFITWRNEQRSDKEVSGRP